MGHFLNFGPGPNMLGEPWQNLEPNHDIRKRLRFDDNSATAILCEHVIEHVSFLQGLVFMREALRVLEPGGVLRLAFPDVSRFVEQEANGDYVLHWHALRYADGLGAGVGLDEEGRKRAGTVRLLTDWGHQSAWTRETAAACLLVTGFARVQQCGYSVGKIMGVDGHHREVGPELARLETSILEAYK